MESWKKWRRDRKTRKLLDETLSPISDALRSATTSSAKGNGAQSELLEQVGQELDRRASATLGIFGTCTWHGTL